ncbi:NUDIX domain-containing protein [Aureimonas psammosilenae]|uniref:NUDIX domain-containing protein n=1 Tax=Aureimonas psammosilenae TaxID=2495496 RepID=UPI0012605ED9|nr:NUDIX domain-containing protein [Aureimonas psammosilenae]
MREVVERRAVRALLLYENKAILLLQIRSPDGRSFWIAPGGGIEQGEEAETGLRRELFEELSLKNVEIGPIVWRRHHIFDWNGRRISQREEYRIVETDWFEPRMLDLQEGAYVQTLRWWPLNELGSAREPLTPLSLDAIVRDYLLNGAPDPIPPEEVLSD